jgi:DNA-binding NarL/FixJ family response regulator
MRRILLARGDAVKPHVSVLVVDDDAVVRAWLRMSVAGTEFYVAGEAASADEARSLVARRNPRILLVDYHLGNKGAQSGVELVRELRVDGVRAPALVMTARPEPGLNEAARAAGVQGTVLKRGQANDLLVALRRVVAGSGVFDPEHPRAAETTDGPPLSKREREVLALVAGGQTNHEIARQLGIGEETVKTLLARAYSKLGVRRRAEAVAAAHERGLL